MINFDLQNHMPLRELVYEELKKQILIGRIAPGTRMMEVELADEMGVSRTPIREAIRKLEKEGLVTIEPRRGAYASRISRKDMLDTLEVRENLEGFAAGLAAERMDKEQIKELLEIAEEFAQAVNGNVIEDVIRSDEKFHKKIFEGTGNDSLIKVGLIVQENALRFRYLYYDDVSRYKNLIFEHNEIANAIVSGNAERAKTISEAHAQKLKDFVESLGEEL